MRVLESVRTGAKSFAWFFKGIMGEDAYDKYKAHYEASHAPGSSDEPGCDAPGRDQAGTHQPLMTEREFWRDQTDRQESNPQSRCC